MVHYQPQLTRFIPAVAHATMTLRFTRYAPSEEASTAARHKSPRREGWIAIWFIAEVRAHQNLREEEDRQKAKGGDDRFLKCDPCQKKLGWDI